MLCLALAAIVLGADHQEYGQLTTAGMRALARGALPLLALASLHLLALDAPAWLGSRARGAVLAVALAADVALASSVIGPVSRRGPPVFWIALVVACLLGAGAAGLLVAGRRARRP